MSTRNDLLELEPEPLPIPPPLPPFEGEADLHFPAEDEPPHALDEGPVAWRADAADVVSIVFAQSRGQARFTVWESAREVGYQIGFCDVKVRRAPEYDGVQLRSGERPKPRTPYGVTAFAAV